MCSNKSFLIDGVLTTRYIALENREKLLCGLCETSQRYLHTGWAASYIYTGEHISYGHYTGCIALLVVLADSNRVAFRFFVAVIF
jgi:hypothetical protein